MNLLLSEQVKSFENLYFYEYYKIRKSFGTAFIIIGVFYAIYYLLAFDYLLFVNNLVGAHLPVVRMLILLIIFIYLGFKINSLKKTNIENGMISKHKITFGWTIILIFSFIHLLVTSSLKQLCVKSIIY